MTINVPSNFNVKEKLVEYKKILSKLIAGKEFIKENRSSSTVAIGIVVEEKPLLYEKLEHITEVNAKNVLIDKIAILEEILNPRREVNFESRDKLIETFLNNKYKEVKNSIVIIKAKIIEIKKRLKLKVCIQQKKLMKGIKYLMISKGFSQYY